MILRFAGNNERARFRSAEISTGNDSSQNGIFGRKGKLPRKTTFLPRKLGKIPLDTKMPFCEEPLPVQK